MKFGAGAIGTLKHGASQVSKLMLGASEVWANFSAQWSGNSRTNQTSQPSYWFELTTSGNLFRMTGSNSSGGWLVANQNGTFTVGSSSSTAVFGSTMKIDAFGNNQLRITTNFQAAPSNVSFIVGSGFSGVSRDYYNNGMETSAGLVRLNGDSYNAGAWISLT